MSHTAFQRPITDEAHAVCDVPIDDALVAEMKARGVAQTATLATYAGLAGADDARRLAADPSVAPYLSARQRGMLGLVWKYGQPCRAQ